MPEVKSSLSKSASAKWNQPSIAFGKRWTGFLMSAEVNASTNRRQAQCYYNMNYWLKVPANPQTQELKTFAIKLVEIVPHAAGVESLFLRMGSQKTKPTTNIKQTAASNESQDLDPQFEDLDQVPEFENGFHGKDEGDQLEGQEDITESGLIDTIFDLKLFNIRVAERQPVTINLDEGPEDEDWNEDDLSDEKLY
ncbi:hypothetical protein DFH28DRAFT_1119745 [Melampsora americana]|nr:hypothetical protein DFH28DRAFT_1119745 [Melampsora americana]